MLFLNAGNGKHDNNTDCGDYIVCARKPQLQKRTGECLAPVKVRKHRTERAEGYLNIAVAVENAQRAHEQERSERFKHPVTEA